MAKTQQPPSAAVRCWARLSMVALAYIRLTSKNIAMLIKRDRLMPKSAKDKEPTERQERCSHLHTVDGGNGYGTWTNCRTCGLRLTYQHTSAKVKSST